MSRTEILIAASLDDVWAVLSDAQLYPEWVVGAAECRKADPNWPEPGARLHHSVGPEPVKIKDFTEVIAYEPKQRIELRANARPLGIATVVIEVSPLGPGESRVVIHEHPARDTLMARVWNPLFDLGIHVRNVASLRRLKAIVEGRRTRKPTT